MVAVRCCFVVFLFSAFLYCSGFCFAFVLYFVPCFAFCFISNIVTKCGKFINNRLLSNKMC